MKKIILALTALVLCTAPAFAAPEINKPAPDFTAATIAGQPFTLSEHKGKIVVLEWNNPECPFVKKHYDSKNMQATQKAAVEKGAEWIVINSSAPGKQGNVTAAEAGKIMIEAGGAPTAEILDATGEVGKLYGASTTPHMFVIDKDGNVAYMGAIDDQPTPDPKTVEGAKNYVLAAVDSLVAGTPVETSITQPYGCSVKYAE